MLVYLGCLCVVLQLAFSHPTPGSTYNGHKVLEIFHKTDEDYIKLLNMELRYDLDFWKMPKHTQDSMYVRVGPKHLQPFLDELKSINADVSTMIEDVQELIDSQNSDTKTETRRSLNRAGSGIILEVYHSYDYINGYLDSLAAMTVPGMNLSVQTLGKSYEGRDIKMIKISAHHGVHPKRAIFIDGGIHAREWVAPATVTYIIENLIFNGGDHDANLLLEKYDVYLVPIVNPDGYDYSHTNFRLWRKNRRVNSGSSCTGVDLNRNFAHHWNPGLGGSYDPCSDIYGGTGPASEPETQAISNFLINEGKKFDAYLTIHSYGQMWLYPWGYTSALPDDWQDLHAAASYATWTLKRLYGTDYIVGEATRTLYSAAGGSDDFAKGAAGIKYSYTIELRDTGRYGFVLPPSLIIPTAEEFYRGLLAFAKVLG